MPGLSPRWMAAGAAALLGFTGGLAAADVLPDPAQNLVAETASQVGLDLPDPDDHAAGVNEHGKHDVGVDEDGANEENENGEHPDNHGKTVSSVAHDDTLEGCEHGQAVSDVASSKNQGNEDAPGLSDDHDPCDHADDAGEEPDDADTDDADTDDADNSGPGNPDHPLGKEGPGSQSGEDGPDEAADHADEHADHADEAADHADEHADHADD